MIPSFSIWVENGNEFLILMGLFLHACRILPSQLLNVVCGGLHLYVWCGQRSLVGVTFFHGEKYGCTNYFLDMAKLLSHKWCQQMKYENHHSCLSHHLSMEDLKMIRRETLKKHRWDADQNFSNVCTLLKCLGLFLIPFLSSWDELYRVHFVAIGSLFISCLYDILMKRHL